ncbi:MAG: RNase LS family HEPN domain-containing protein [bacterium]|nr:RNase LS family HEPN domain-containing protein [bacterium]
MDSLITKIWWNYLGEDIQQLMEESFVLFEKAGTWEEKFTDYSFVVFPAAKAYEGFLKKMFFDLGFITREDYEGKHLRIGKELNPFLPKKIESAGVYKKLVKYCGGEELANNLWDTWKTSRNLTFHYFPNEKNALTLWEAGDRLEMIVGAIDMAFKECKINSK